MAKKDVWNFWLIHAKRAVTCKSRTQDAAAQAAGLRRSFLTPSLNRPCWSWRTGFCLGHAASYPWQSASASSQSLFPANHCAAGRGPTSKLDRPGGISGLDFVLPVIQLFSCLQASVFLFFSRAMFSTVSGLTCGRFFKHQL